MWGRSNSAILHHRSTARIRKTWCQPYSSVSSWTVLRPLYVELPCRVPGHRPQSTPAFLTNPWPSSQVSSVHGESPAPELEEIHPPSLSKAFDSGYGFQSSAKDAVGT